MQLNLIKPSKHAKIKLNQNDLQMCGIAGIIGESDQSLGRKLIKKIKHRGPNGMHIWSSKTGEYPATLAHSRLSIIDLSSQGDQPYISKNGRYILSFNGEIYNFIELRMELEAKGAIFDSKSDTEVLLQGLMIEGSSFLKKCNGMWAFCFYDRKTNQALFARDRFGVKPLYYTLLPGSKIAFASEMKALTILLDNIEPHPDINIGHNYFNYECTTQTVFRDINRLQSGYIARFKGGKISKEKWWSTLENINQISNSYEEQIEKWRSIFIDSVKIRMRSDVKLGTALSGGLDSSSVAAVMHQLSSTSQFSNCQKNFRNAICSHYPGNDLDETIWARQVADSCEMNLSLNPISFTNSNWNIVESLYQTEDPYLTYSLPMLSVYSEFRRQGIAVTLDGHGSDEMFSGYGHLTKALRCTTNLTKMKEILLIHESTHSGVYSSKEKLKNRSLAAAYAKVLLSNSKSNLSAIRNRFKGSVNHEFQQILDNERNEERFSLLDPFTKIMYELFHFTVLPTLLRNYDKYSMASGIEVRMPFMDWRLVTYTFSLPWTSKLGGGYTKRIQRDAMKGILVDQVRLRRDKIGWNAPLHEWLKSGLKDEVEEIFSEFKNDSTYSTKYTMWQNFLRKPSPGFQEATDIWSKAILPLAWRTCIDRGFFS